MGPSQKKHEPSSIADTNGTGSAAVAFRNRWKQFGDTSPDAKLDLFSSYASFGKNGGIAAGLAASCFFNTSEVYVRVCTQSKVYVHGCTRSTCCYIKKTCIFFLMEKCFSRSCLTIMSQRRVEGQYTILDDNQWRDEAFDFISYSKRSDASSDPNSQVRIAMC